MEGHEVPKNVTEFEFHLVGDMTIKQFAYLATGLGIAYLTFVLIGTKLPIIAWPLILTFSGIGAAYAFLPISERPLDHWTASFFRAIFMPTQRSFKSKVLKIEDPQFSQRLNSYLTDVLKTFIPVPSNLPKPTVVASFEPSAVKTPEIKPPTNIQPTNTPKPQTLQKEILPQFAPKDFDVFSLPSSEQLNETVELAKQAQIIKEKIIQAQQALNQIKIKASAPGEDQSKYSEYIEQMNSVISNLNQRAIEVSKKLAELSKYPSQETSAPKKTVVIKQEPVKQPTIQIVLTTIPNIINGIVTDSGGNYLEGVVVVTHNKQNLPVRALKTNKLGQFLAATPLPNGVYTITLEKDALNFDTLEIELQGQVLPPIRVSAKKGEVA